MPLFLCAGTPRSGSTWLYNAMRCILARRFPDLYACWVGDFDRDRAAAAGAVLVKLHANDDDLARKADVILTCHRDLRDVAASSQSMGWASDDSQLLDLIRNWRSFHEYWSSRSQIDLVYSDIMERPEEALRAVAAALDVHFEDREFSGFAKLLGDTPNNRDDNSIHDQEFLTHRNHRNDGRDGRWRDQLSEALGAAITEEHREWLIRMGYDTSYPDQRP